MMEVVEYTTTPAGTVFVGSSITFTGTYPGFPRKNRWFWYLAKFLVQKHFKVILEVLRKTLFQIHILTEVQKTFQVFVCYTNAIYPPFKYSCFYLHIYLVVKHNLVFDSNLVVYHRTTWRICQPKLNKQNNSL